MSSSFDIVSSLTAEAATLVTTVGAVIAAGLTVWIVGLGANVGIKKFQGIVKKS